MLIELPNGNWIEASSVLAVKYGQGGGPHEGVQWIDVVTEQEDLDARIILADDMTKEKARQLVRHVVSMVNTGKTRHEG